MLGLGLNGIGILSALLGLAIVIRLVSRRLMPARACLAGAALGFGGWLAYVVSKGKWGSADRSVAAVVWLFWAAMAPLVVPLEAGVLGWMGAGPIRRWFFLAAGVVLAVSLVLLAILLAN
jgi:hypothetical protein